jgi:hypothetical protein
MGSNLLRIIVAGLAAIVTALGATVIAEPAPGSISPQLWGVIGVAVKFVVDFITAKLGPKPTIPPATGPTGSF